MHLPQVLSTAIENKFSELGLVTKIEEFTHASGGCINSAGKLKTTKGNYFLKWNQIPKMFEVESRGLNLLSKADKLRIPQVLFTIEVGEIHAIIMEFLDPGHQSDLFWVNLGKGLADLHRNSADQFGLNHNNYIGSLTQLNIPSSSWIAFFTESRLMAQMKLGIGNGLFEEKWGENLNRLALKLPSIIPEVDTPSLLHGDLWNGNMMATIDYQACLFDPAVYFGHREVDLAFSRMFGGFDSIFYETYNESWPLEPGFEERIEIYNLYPLLVHANLFGGGYISQCKSLISRYL